MNGRRWTLPVFIALAFLHVAPIWSVRYLPTTDGPSHVYNAWVLRGLVTGDAPPNIERYYKVDWKAHPNWTSHAFMAVAMSVVPPLVAEKILVTLIVFILLGAAWFFVTTVDPRNDLYAFLAFPVAWSEQLVTGFYNHILGIGLFLIILGIWWRRRNRPSIGSIALLALLLVFCNFTHPMATLLACGAIVLLSLLTRRFAHLIALVPVVPLIVMFASAPQADTHQPPQFTIDWTAAGVLARFDTLRPWGQHSIPIAIAAGVLFVALLATTLARRERREQDVIGVLALALMAMMFWLPAPPEIRRMFTSRMIPFLLPVLAAWFVPLPSARWRKTFAVLVIAVAVANGIFVFERIRHFGSRLENIVRAFDAIEPETTLLPLLFERPHSKTPVNVYAHFTSYVALEKGLVDFMNYETYSHLFPIVDRLPVPSSFIVEYTPGKIDLGQPLARADYIITYGDASRAENRGSLNVYYEPVGEKRAFQIYRRRPPVRGPRELILLPLIGTRDLVNAPNGARWRVEQSVRNNASHPVRVLFRRCPDDLWCDRELAPGEVAAIAGTGTRFAFVDVPRGAGDQLEITTNVRRVDVERPETTIEIPAIHERMFTRAGARIENIDTRGKKIGLRVYVISERPANEVTVRLRRGSRGNGTQLAQWNVGVENLGVYGNAELRSEIGGAPLPDVLDIDIDAPDVARVWAFVTATDERERTQLYRSR